MTGKRLPPALRALCDEYPGRITSRQGSKHTLVEVDGKVVATIGADGKTSKNTFTVKNTIARLRRALRGL